MAKPAPPPNRPPIPKKVTIPTTPTRGLLSSMALRFDHSFGMPVGEFSFASPGYTPEQRETLLEKMSKVYNIVVSYGELSDGNTVIDRELSVKLRDMMLSVFEGDACSISMNQIYEEIAGDGFYRPSKEKDYEMIIHRGVRP